MTKKQFLDELEERLKRLPYQERTEAISYYDEYFEEAGYKNEKEVIEELKSPAHIAAKILSDYATTSLDSKNNNPKGRAKSVWFTILSIFAAPIAIPLAILLSGIIITFSLAFVVLVFALILGGGVLALASIIMLFIQPATAVMMIGVILIAIGATKGVYLFVKWIIKIISNFIRRI